MPLNQQHQDYFRFHPSKCCDLSSAAINSGLRWLCIAYWELLF